MMTNGQTVLRVEPLVIQKNQPQSVTPYQDNREVQISVLPINPRILSQPDMNNVVSQQSIFNQHYNPGQVGPYQTQRTWLKQTNQSSLPGLNRPST